MHGWIPTDVEPLPGFVGSTAELRQLANAAIADQERDPDQDWGMLVDLDGVPECWLAWAAGASPERVGKLLDLDTILRTHANTQTFGDGSDTAAQLRAVLSEAERMASENEDLRREIAELRGQLDAHRGAAANLRMTVSADRGAVPCRSLGEGESPPAGWYYLFSGPHTSYTLPDLGKNGQLSWWRYDHDEGCWDENETLRIRLVDEDDLVEWWAVLNEAAQALGDLELAGRCKQASEAIGERC